MHLQADDIVGDYRILRPLGRGGLGAVYEARHLISQRAEALKVLLSEQRATPAMAERFRREVQLLASLNHPNIAGLHNAFYHQQQLVMVMELVTGEDLRVRSARQRLTLQEIVHLAAEILAGLHYAHGMGVVHRDIKPANIMITPTGVAKLLDFGIAITEQSANLTVAGSLIGSPAQISPEQIRGEKATPQSDIYSLGVTLYEMIAGEPPFRGGSTFELLSAHILQVPRPLREVNPEIPRQLSDMIAKALEKEPGQRHSTAEDFLSALASLQSAELRRTLPALPTQTKLAEPVQSSSLGVEDKTQSAAPTGRAGTPHPNAADTLTRHLAVFIGPIAKVIVTRLSKQTHNLEELYTLAARQIEDEGDRKRFLGTRPRAE